MIRILLADDETFMRESLAAALTFEGLTVDAFEDAEGALAHAAMAVRYDAVIVDVMMFKEEQLIQLVKSVHGAPVTLISGLHADHLAALAERVGAAHWLEKPLFLRELHRVLFDQIRARS